MKCIIIDDDLLGRTVIRELVTSKTDYIIDAEFESAIDAIKYLNKNTVDLIFLDIHMPVFNGFDFIDTLKHKINVVFVTSDKEYAINAFEYDNVVDYIIKPVSADRFDVTLKKINSFNEIKLNLKNKSLKNATENTGLSFYINVDKRFIKMDANSILYFQAKGDYVIIKTESKSYIVNNTLKKLESKLPNDIFFKTHRSYLINTKKIIDIEENTLLIGKDIIPISRRNRPQLMKTLNLL